MYLYIKVNLIKFGVQYNLQLKTSRVQRKHMNKEKSCGFHSISTNWILSRHTLNI